LTTVLGHHESEAQVLVDERSCHVIKEQFARADPLQVARSRFGMMKRSQT